MLHHREVLQINDFDFNIFLVVHYIPVPDNRGLTWVCYHVLPLFGLLAPRAVPA